MIGRYPGLGALALGLLITAPAQAAGKAAAAGPSFAISFPAATETKALDGRVILL